MRDFPAFSEEELEADVEATAYVHQLRQAIPRATEERRCSRVSYVVWKTRGVQAVLKEVRLPPEDTFTRLGTIQARLLELEKVREASGVEWPLTKYLALHVDTDHNYQWLLERAGLVTLHDVMNASCPTSLPFPPVTERFIRVVIREVLRALWILHEELGLVHGDVSPSNVLLSFDWKGVQQLVPTQVKLGDLEGVSPRVPFSQGDDNVAVLPFCGSPLYTPLEVLLQSETHAASAVDTDVWAVGILLFQLLSGKGPTASPFVDAYKESGSGGHKTVLELICALKAAKQAAEEDPAALLRLLREGLPRASEEAVLVVSHCLDWRNQWTVGQLLKLEWIGME